ncbi:hypothetical protein GLE_2520 [Lysobacter enzymogenes]|uniref:Carbohydrate-binding domain-containing protein n=1 Tax=Lysobacter enzymogenes TaxID=69 RepID=A0A0S2DHN0_LYSEN|nr:hypothetical protein [Lysobacter enzymogenes]ALN57869.1 hypothetical protein GLE_2520 [Lysobacter enzymogenes]
MRGLRASANQACSNQARSKPIQTRPAPAAARALLCFAAWLTPACAALAIEARRLDASSPSFPAPADWDAAERHDAFWMYKPRDGVASPLRTQVQVACDDQALFFRVVADGQGSGGVRAPLARRDQIADDQDYVSVFIDTNGDGKSAYFFRVNPSGSLADGTYVAISDNQDFHPDFDASARGAANADGYAVDLRIARSQLRNRGSDGRGWRYLVMRNVPGAERMILASGELKQNATSYLSASQPLDMARCPGAGGEWEAGAHLTARRHEQKTGAVSQSDGVDTQLGGYLKWSDGAHLAVHATYRPDFSQVELDIPQLQSNAQYALFLPEKRDFFLEDTDLLELPTRSQLQGGGGGLAVYTRTITDPRWGARMSYRNQGRDFTALVADDRAGGVVAIPGPFGTAYVAQPASLLLLERASLARGAWRFGQFLSHRDYHGAGRNTVAGADASWQPSAIAKARAMLLFSATTAQPQQGLLRPGERSQGTYAFVDWARLGRDWETSLTLERASEDWRNDTGYMPQSDFAQLTGVVTRRWRFDGPWSSISAFVWTAHSQTVSSGETILTRYAPGVWFSGPYDLQLVAEYHPGERRRVGGYGARLHRMDQWFFQVSSSLSQTVPALSFEILAGDQLDYAADALGRGYQASFSGKIRPLAWLEVQPRVSYWYMNASAHDLHARETSAQLLVNANFEAGSFLRLIAQYSRNRRQEPLLRGPAPDPSGLALPDWLDRRGNLQSLVYSNNAHPRWGFDVGATRSQDYASGDPKRYVLDLFAKVVVRLR